MTAATPQVRQGARETILRQPATKPREISVPIEVPEHAKKIHPLPAIRRHDPDQRGATRVSEALHRAQDQWQEWNNLAIKENEKREKLGALHQAPNEQASAFED